MLKQRTIPANGEFLHTYFDNDHYLIQVAVMLDRFLKLHRKFGASVKCDTWKSFCATCGLLYLLIRQNTYMTTTTVIVMSYG